VISSACVWNPGTVLCQRWRGGKLRWRPAVEGFDPRAYEVAPIADDTTTRRFVVEHHYARSYPAARRRFGLYARGGALVGVAVYSVPMHPAVLRPWSSSDACELGRLVLLDEVPGNAESWFVARTFDALRVEGFAGVVSYSDPVRRVALDGTVVLPGHAGIVYQALGAVYTGRGRSQTLRLLPDGSVLSGRAVAKIRGGERGWRYAVAQLVAAGARAPLAGEDLRGWLDAVLPGLVRPLRHDGCHRYVWGLTEGAKRDAGASLPYPRAPRVVCEAVTAMCARAA
jgi:hypothetical protein